LLILLKLPQGPGIVLGEASDTHCRFVIGDVLDHCGLWLGNECFSLGWLAAVDKGLDD
jgi:hypothetical protein